MYISETIEDPYANCEDGGCHHDLCDGVSIEELLAHDGPNSPAPVSTSRRSTKKMSRPPTPPEEAKIQDALEIILLRHKGLSYEHPRWDSTLHNACWGNQPDVHPADGGSDAG